MTRALRGLLWALERPLAVAPAPITQRDVLLVLGAPLTTHGKLSRVLHERIAQAAMLWQRGAAKAIIVSGGATRVGLPSEASAMAAGLLQAGIPAAAIIVEDQARTTAENATFAAALMQQHGWHTAWIVTQPFHLRRAVRLCQHAGIAAQAWVIADSLQHAQPLLGLRWTTREYAAWGAWWWRRTRGAR